MMGRLETRDLFLKGIWKGAVDPESDRWIEEQLTLAREYPEGAGTDAGRALRELLAAGVDRSLLTRLVFSMQFRCLFHVCSLLDDPGPALEEEADEEERSWALVEFRGEQITDVLVGLHESLLMYAPGDRLP